MRKHAVLLVVLVLVAGACGNRTGDGDDAAPPSGGDEGEVEAGEATDVGVTGDSITIGVIADLTGVVPGLFKAAPDAVKAFAAMVNEDGGINGRELVVKEYDTGTNDNGNRLAYVRQVVDPSNPPMQSRLNDCSKIWSRSSSACLRSVMSTCAMIAPRCLSSCNGLAANLNQR